MINHIWSSIVQCSKFLPCFPLNTTPMSETMSFGEPDPDLNPDQILGWLDDSTLHSPLILDDLYCTMDDPWFGLDPIDAKTISSSSSSSPIVDLFITDQPQQAASELSKKQKAPEDHTPRVGKNSSGNKKGAGKSAKGDNNIGSNKNGRWAEQLLNPCAAAITTGNMTRVQHLLFVLNELASPSGDANYRLAAHGMQALLHHLHCYQYPHRPDGRLEKAPSFTTSTPKLFKQSLIYFNDINPWFTIPNNIANNAVLQVLSEQDHGSCNALHILDIGVSHGFQWPTLLEALSRRPGGPPPLVRITVVPPTLDNHQLPFASCPPGYDFASNILRFAKDVDINLQFNKLDNIPLRNLNADAISFSEDETLIVCAQFRLHGISHNEPDDRTEFLKLMRNMSPQGVILSDNNMDCSCDNCSSFDSGFARRLDYLWSFLDSTSVAFKGRDMEERRVVEGEAAKALISMCEMNERKEKWGERMNGVGFVKHAFADDVVDQARALLRKYDSRWEMRVEDRSVGLWWKGQPVSFCSLRKTD
ncbi:putative transcription factor GRAS family [Helianthus annuus]|uniref:Putative transcription factor GRAS, Scarecrow-like protein 29/nodulation signaling pathway 1 n=4 Tax=Helianthus annuus TaxID=4232 RepID=A0A251SZI3_HELAN|nr:putative transcription factor GRAS family [Helianthus annuus]KAF5776841.1 putative transcription factor GRAS family [Helianthus annuus]KAJ0491999.1 putative transcription factor GRAS family [Helianthus annuus]KAJ0492003.1 putative transcription factor GRAS family [Helianthus annuus]KAJ0861677.1 putative transcription factor GRAS family [Helianthus annuus]